jgi:hypothetical protein
MRFIMLKRFIPTARNVLTNSSSTLFSQASHSYKTQTNNKEEFKINRPFAEKHEQLVSNATNMSEQKHLRKIRYDKIFSQPFANYKGENLYGLYMHMISVNPQLYPSLKDNAEAREKILNLIQDSKILIGTDPGENIGSASTPGAHAFIFASGESFETKASNNTTTGVLFTTSEPLISNGDLVRSEGKILPMQHMIASYHAGQWQIHDTKLASYLEGKNEKFDQALQEAIQSQSPTMKR